MYELPLRPPVWRGFFIILLASLLLFGCNRAERDAQQVINDALVAHGWHNYKQGVISFRQDGVLYRVLREDDAYLHSRSFTNPNGQYVHDVFDGSGFKRTLEEQEVALEEDEYKEHREAIRSVVFFALLPYGLKDSRFKSEYTGNARLKGEPYHKLRVTLPGGRGKVADPPKGIYQLWVHRERHTLDYFVYTPSGEDSRSLFCQAVNPRTINGIRFQDYNMYTTDRRISAARLDYAFEASELTKVSGIKLEDIQAEPLPPL